MSPEQANLADDNSTTAKGRQGGGDVSEEEILGDHPASTKYLREEGLRAWSEYQAVRFEWMAMAVVGVGSLSDFDIDFVYITTTRETTFTR